jgi:hypothetical protein
MLTLTGTTKVPKIEESAFSANPYLIKWIVPRAQPSALARPITNTLYLKSQVWNNAWAIKICDESHQGGL